MPTRIGLMGLGRIGRNLFRLLHENPDLEIAAVSDIADPAALAYLLQFDTILGRFPVRVGYEDGEMTVGDRRIPIVGGTRPGEVDWAAYGVDTVIEATSRPRSRAELSLHFEKGARRLILCSRPADPPDVTVVPGVNDGDLKAEHRIVSNASSTAHAAAPVLKVLGERFGIVRAFDSLATMVLQGHVSKTLSWFDNGWGYAHRVVGLLGRFRELDRLDHLDREGAP